MIRAVRPATARRRSGWQGVGYYPETSAWHYTESAVSGVQLSSSLLRSSMLRHFNQLGNSGTVHLLRTRLHEGVHLPRHDVSQIQSLRISSPVTGRTDESERAR